MCGLINKAFLMVVFLLMIVPKVVYGQDKAIDTLISLIGRGNTLISEGNYDAADEVLAEINEMTSAGDLVIPFVHEAEIALFKSRVDLAQKRQVECDSFYQWINQNKHQFNSQEEIKTLVRLLNNAGIAFKRASRLTDSQKAYVEASEALQRLAVPDYFMQGSILANAGNALKQLGEFTRAIDYLEQGSRNLDAFIAESQPGSSVTRALTAKSQNLNNLGLIYQGLGDHDKAIVNFNECLEIKRKSDTGNLPMVSSNLSISLIELGQYTLADSLLGEVVRSYPGQEQIDRTWIQITLNRADLLLKLAKDTNAFYPEIRKIKNVIRKELPLSLDLMTTASLMEIRALKDQSRFVEALHETSNSLALISKEKSLIINSQNVPVGFQTNMHDEFIKLMDLRSDLMMQQGLAGRDTALLKTALFNYDFTRSLIDSVNRSLQNQSSRIELSRFQRATYNNLINLTHDLFMITGNSMYIDQCFKYMEQSKSAGLWATIREADVKTTLIPEDQLNAENNIKTKIADIQGEILERRAASRIDQEEVELLEQERFSLTLQLDSLIQQFRQVYPQYYKLKFDTSIYDLADVKSKLTPGQVLIEYAVTDRMIVIIASSSEQTEIFSTPFTALIENELLFLVDLVKGRESNFDTESLLRFARTGNQLYQILLGKLDLINRAEELVIIPDGILSFIPFEILLTRESGETRPDFRTLPYLLRNKVVNYAYTATLLYYSEERQVKPRSRVLAVAPDYNFNKRTVSDFIRSNSERLPYLAGITREAGEINRIAGGRILLGRNASENKFKRIAHNFSVLHLAMHALPDQEDPMNTCLVFTPGTSKKEDGLLYAHEIYNIRLNASLTVLSACETGSGELISGEGILSLARGFIYSGCPNLIMTLWTVDDESSNKLMGLFYRHLSSEVKIGQALQKSKLQYIETADKIHAHPHFWAGYIELGQNQHLAMPEEKNKLIIVIPLVALALIFSLLLIHPRRYLRNGRQQRVQ